MSLSKKSYFQGGGGVNEPTPGKVKYPAEPAILVQPRFKEPFYRNYDLYDTEGVDGPAQHGPGSGWNHMNEHDSVDDFLKFRRQRLKGKYVADNFWITEDNYNERVKRMDNISKRRAALQPLLVKTAADENDGPNFDYGKGLYSNMDKYKSVQDFEEHADKGPGAFFADDNKDHMMPPKEHGTSIYDWRNSPYQGKPGGDKSHIDFPFDNVEGDIDSGSIIGDSESYLTPRQLGPAGPPDDTTISPGQVNLGDFESYPYSAQIGGLLDKYLPQNDFEDKPDSDLDIGRDYTDEDGFPQAGRRFESECDPDALVYDEGRDAYRCSQCGAKGENGPYHPKPSSAEVHQIHHEREHENRLQELEDKYLSPSPTHGLFGLPDGVDLPDEDLGDPTDINPDFGTYGPESTMYEDKWNI